MEVWKWHFFYINLMVPFLFSSLYKVIYIITVLLYYRISPKPILFRTFNLPYLCSRMSWNNKLWLKILRRESTTEYSKIQWVFFMYKKSLNPLVVVSIAPVIFSDDPSAVPTYLVDCKLLPDSCNCIHCNQPLQLCTGKKLNGRPVAQGDQIFGWANIIYFAACPAGD